MKCPVKVWPTAIFALLGMNMAIVGITVYYATNDPSAAVESDYYQKAVDWDQTVAKRQASDLLGWTPQPRLVRSETGTHLRLTLTDRDGHAVHGAKVNAVVFHNARAATRFSIDLLEGEPGEYAAAVSADRPGSWHVDLAATRGEDSFIATLNCELAGGTGTALSEPGR